MLTAIYLKNWLPSRVLDFKSPFVVLKNRLVDFSHLKVFGYICFVHIQAPHHDKLDPCSVKCLFLDILQLIEDTSALTLLLTKLWCPPRVVKFEESIPFFHKESIGLGEGETWADLFPLPNSSVDLDLDLIPCNVSYAPASEQLPSSLPLSSCDASQSHE